MPGDARELCAAADHVPAGASHRRWTLRVEHHGYYHNVVRVGESPLYLDLSWRMTKTTQVKRVGLFCLDLHGLLRHGFIRRERGTASGVRVRVVRAEDGQFYIQAREDGPRLRMGMAEG